MDEFAPSYFQIPLSRIQPSPPTGNLLTITSAVVAIHWHDSVGDKVPPWAAFRGLRKDLRLENSDSDMALIPYPGRRNPAKPQAFSRSDTLPKTSCPAKYPNAGCLT
ncbi:MAG: hypothetical protein ABI162_19800 [Luteolibacter sp.]